MTKMKHKKRHGRLILILCMILYAAVFLAVTAYGLEYLWGVMEAYEGSRPHIAIDSYMARLDGDYVCDRSGAVIGQVDHSIQSEEECRQVIRDFLKDGISYAKKSSQCTDTRQVYVLRSGKQVIGQFEMEAIGEPVHGFTPWKVTGDSFDLSFLLTGTVSTLAPSDYPVYVNGVRLTQDHITQTGIQYDVLSQFYADYTLPYLVKYQAGPCLGDISLQVTDPQGQPVTIDENTDVNGFLDNCAPEELTQLQSFVEEYVHHYVTFMSNCSGSTEYNYQKLANCILPGTTLRSRMEQSIEGLFWVRHTSMVIEDITIHHSVSLGDGKYICDLTYSALLSGKTRTGGNIQLVIVQTERGLKAETMFIN